MNKTTLLYLLAWLPMIILAILNALIRELLFLKYMTEHAAHQLSTITLICIFFLYIWFLHARRPLQTRQQAVIVGTAWAVLTILFEFGIGWFISGLSWQEMLAAYNLAAGNLWMLVPLSLAVLPMIIFQFHKGKES